MVSRNDSCRKIKSTFLTMVRKNADNKIKVKDLVEQSGVSKACFYINYENLNDVISEIGEDFIEDFFSRFTTSPAQKILFSANSFPLIASFLKDNLFIMRLLFRSDIAKAFQHKWERKIGKSIRNRFIAEKITDSEQQYQQVASILAIGFVGRMQEIIFADYDAAPEIVSCLIGMERILINYSSQETRVLLHNTKFTEKNTLPK